VPPVRTTVASHTAMKHNANRHAHPTAAILNLTNSDSASNMSQNEGEEDHIATSLTFLDFEYTGDTQGSQFEYTDFSLGSQTQSQTQQLGATLTQEAGEKFPPPQASEAASQPGSALFLLIS
jgi:hypothetical protein